MVAAATPDPGTFSASNGTVTSSDTAPLPDPMLTMISGALPARELHSRKPRSTAATAAPTASARIAAVSVPRFNMSTLPYPSFLPPVFHRTGTTGNSYASWISPRLSVVCV